MLVAFASPSLVLIARATHLKRVLQHPNERAQRLRDVATELDRIAALGPKTEIVGVALGAQLQALRPLQEAAAVVQPHQQLATHDGDGLFAPRQVLPQRHVRRELLFEAAAPRHRDAECAERERVPRRQARHDGGAPVDAATRHQARHGALWPRLAERHHAQAGHRVAARHDLVRSEQVRGARESLVAVQLVAELAAGDDMPSQLVGEVTPAAIVVEQQPR